MHALEDVQFDRLLPPPTKSPPPPDHPTAEEEAMEEDTDEIERKTKFGTFDIRPREGDPAAEEVAGAAIQECSFEKYTLTGFGTYFCLLVPIPSNSCLVTIFWVGTYASISQRFVEAGPFCWSSVHRPTNAHRLLVVEQICAVFPLT